MSTMGKVTIFFYITNDFCWLFYIRIAKYIVKKYGHNNKKEENSNKKESGSFI